MKGFKGFAPGLVCRGKQYAENTVFEEPNAEICKSGMHFCENPFDVLEYYDLVNADGSFNDFAEVEALDTWLEPPDLNNAGWKCSNCGIDLGDYLTDCLGVTVYVDEEDKMPKIKSCPHCSAKMDTKEA